MNNQSDSESETSECRTLNNAPSSADVHTDSSDIEVLLEQNSSDSIEVLDDAKQTQAESDTATLNSSPMTSGSSPRAPSDRPDSLVLPRPLQYYERQQKKQSESSLSSRCSSMDALLDIETPLSMHGTVDKDGDMTTFFAEDLTDMIKRSSPMTRSRTESSVSSWSYGPSGAHTPSARSVSSISTSTSGWDSSASSITGYSYSGISSKKKKLKNGKKHLTLEEALTGSRSASELTQSPDDIPPIDPRALMDLEVHAQKTADSLHNMMASLSKDLHKMSSLTHACLGAYAEGVDRTCDAVDSSIKSMYALMAKCEELNASMKPIYTLHEQIKEIKRLLDLFESQMTKKEKS